MINLKSLTPLQLMMYQWLIFLILFIIISIEKMD